MAERKRLSLANRYRPQTFAQVVGQDLATTALAQAALKSSPAPAYLLSGTRGVGKTTIARIFAKALNCANGPAQEPCNECSQCLHITAGNHVDVCEIDGASNTGVDDVRALRENLGFMPMEGKFKIFIVDEAHMLSKSAFNALLKTLEEPPGHTVFIFATTEPQRFPATIISRCQHFVFRHLSEEMLAAHLAEILNQEKIPFDDGALKVIAKRASGSVRDSLSLLDQVLAPGTERLTPESCRKALGLAGQEFFDSLFTSLVKADFTQTVTLCTELLSSGIDTGFFLRELVNWLRNLFLLRQSGEAILPVLQLAPDEMALLKKHAPQFTASQLHAAWQMVLESQKGIVQSPEPGPALELLLLNLALLPRLAPISQINNLLFQENRLEEPVKGWSTSADNDSSSVRKENTAALSWEGFLEFCQKEAAEDVPPREILRQLKVQWQPDKIIISAGNTALWERLQKCRGLLNNALLRYCQGNMPALEFVQPKPARTHAELLEECANNPAIKLCTETFDASIVDCREKPVNQSGS